MEKSSDVQRMPKHTYEARVKKVREALVEMQVALKRAPFAVVLTVAGDDAAGKGEFVNLLNGWLDPRGTETHAFHAPTDEERGRPPMWRYWRTLPSHGKIGIYVGGWHADALALEPRTASARSSFDRTAQQLLRFERLLAAEGMLIVKVWLRLSKRDQGTRLRGLKADPDTAWRVTNEDWQHYRAYNRRAALGERLRQITNHVSTPWHEVDASDPRARNLAVAEHLLERFHAHAKSQAKLAKLAAPKTITSLRAGGRKRLAAVPLDRRLSESDYEEQIDQWLGRLNRAVRAAAARRRSIVWVFEGWDAAGKGGTIRRITRAIDARDYRVIPIAKPSDEEKAQHYLWRFWRHVPRSGRVTIYDRSWYGRVLVERIEGFCSERAWRRAYDEINDFEAQLRGHGTVVLKFWLHLSPEEQLERFEARAKTPYKRHKIDAEDWRNRERWADYEIAVGDMLALTDRPGARWHVVPADNKRYARVEVLKRSCEEITAALG